MARILVFDGQGVYRTGLRVVISANIPCAKIIEASSLIEASSEIRKDVFDLVLVGIDRSSSESLDFLKSARQAALTTRFALRLPRKLRAMHPTDDSAEKCYPRR